MFRRAALLLGLSATLVAVPQGLSADTASPLVRVRVEGRTATIFGATQPRARAATALQALDVASTTGEFYYRLQATDFGPYVAQIGRYPGEGSGGWVFKVNGASPPVGADKVELRAGDVVLWYWATFTEAGGPPTLSLTAAGRDCYRVVAQDDAGTSVSVAKLSILAGGRRIAVDAKRTCLGPHRGVVRAVAPGAVRSNALP